MSNVSVLPVNELWNDIEKIIFKEPLELPAVSKAIQMSTSALQQFTGKYMSDQQELNIRLFNGQLYAQLGAKPPFEIYPENRNVFFGKKVNVHITFDVNVEGNITALEAEAKRADSSFQ